MSKPTVSKSNLQHLIQILILFCGVTIVLLCLSPDSYIYDTFGRCDSAWFFTCGKAWMEGMTPYVDFADSKGPLLWLIYGIGYLLSKTSYHGVFWLSVATYCICLGIAYKITTLYPMGKKGRWLVLSLLPVALFYKRIHDEVRAEDFSLPFVFAGLYVICRIVQGTTRKQTNKFAFILGFCMACCLLIKWSTFLMMGGMALTVAYFSLKQHNFGGIPMGVAGMFTATFPFLIYFMIEGNLGAFIQEYFLNTSSTLSGETNKNIIDMLCAKIKYFPKVELIIFFGIILAYPNKNSKWLLFCYLTFIAVLCCAPGRAYYHAIVMPFTIFIFIFIAKVCEKWYFNLRDNIYILGLAVILGGGILYNLHRERSMVFKVSHDRDRYQMLEQLMCRKPKSLIMCYSHDYGVGLAARCLPACKYWARQNGATPEMDVERQKTLLARKPDFITVSPFCFQKDTLVKKLKTLNYTYWGKIRGEHVGEYLDIYYK